ncbi:hypothetical protein N7G274_010278 [Stereocaulon virgatum]|uniref:Cytochrome P450 n=1 Tax=Stereocaulon virgatum TaxID=373712 RepID=A0ABR3ZW71_9LECA
MSTMNTQFVADAIASASQSLTIKALILLGVIACTTRFISGRNYKTELSNYGDASKVATLPYWVPYLGHIFPMLLNPMRFLHSCKKQATNQIFALYLFGSKYIIVWTPMLVDSIFENPNAAFNSSERSWLINSRVFGAAKKHKQNYLKEHSTARRSLHQQLSSNPNTLELVQPIIRGIQEHTPELVSFSTSIVDQNIWERTASPTIDISAVEINLFTLIKNFVGQISLPALAGNEFLEAYPTTLDDLWDLDGGIKWLMLGVNRLLGIPSLTRAHLARRRLLDALHTFHRAIDGVHAGDEPKEPFRQLSDVGSLLETSRSLWRSSSLRDVNGLYDLSLLWAVSTKPSHLIFWMLLHIWATPGLANQVRDEIKIYATATQPPRDFGIPEPPRLKIDIGGLVKSCPLLKACYYECVRLYSAPTSVGSVNNDMIIRGDRDDGVEPPKFSLDAGSNVAAPLSLHHYDPNFFKDPHVFRPGRFLQANKDGKGQQTFVPGTIKPWGIGDSACPGRDLAQKQVLAFVVGILALWNFEPADNKGWKVPDQVERAVISVPAVDIRVNLRPRELL